MYINIHCYDNLEKYTKSILITEITDLFLSFVFLTQFLTKYQFLW